MLLTTFNGLLTKFDRLVLVRWLKVYSFVISTLVEVGLVSF